MPLPLVLDAGFFRAIQFELVTRSGRVPTDATWRLQCAPNIPSPACTITDRIEIEAGQGVIAILAGLLGVGICDVGTR